MPTLSPTGQSPMLYPGAEEEAATDPAMEFANRYRAMLQQAGMLPRMQVPQPSAEDIQAAELARRRATYMRPVDAFSGRAISDPNAAYSEALKSRMAANPAAMQYAHEIEQAKAMRDMTSPDLISYMGALAGGSTMSLPDFLASQRSFGGGMNDFTTKLQTLMAIRQQQAQQTGEPPKPVTEEDMFRIMRQDQTGMMGSVGYRVDPVTGQAVFLASPGQVGAMAGEVARGEQSGSKVGEGEGQQISDTKNALWGFETAYGDVQSMLDNSERWLQQIESGQIETGPINAWLYNTLGMNAGDVAGLKTAQIAEGLKNLQTTNLAPVSNVELALIMQMWANIAAGKDANRSTLEEAIRRTKKLQSSMVKGLNINANRLKRLAPGEWMDIESTLGDLPRSFLNGGSSQEIPPLPNGMREVKQ